VTFNFDIFIRDDETPSRPKRGAYERTAPMTATFTVGEEVRVTTQGHNARVEFGPYTPVAGSRSDVYLVTMTTGPEKGNAVSALSSAMRALPKFTRGDTVQVGLLRTPATVAAGPFQDRDRKVFYVLEHVNGTHETRPESNLEKVEAAQTRYYALAGTRWDLEAKYIDTDGDVWSFNGKRVDGVPLLDSPDAGYGYRDYSLTRVISSFGPLVKRTD
jgi:hypothetical protein